MEKLLPGVPGGHAENSIALGTHVAHETLYAGNWVRCIRLPMLVLISK
jgi:hypothetical protein